MPRPGTSFWNYIRQSSTAGIPLALMINHCPRKERIPHNLFPFYDLKLTFKSLCLCWTAGLAAEHFIHAHSVTHIFLSLLLNAFILHGHQPTHLMKTAI